MSVIQNNTTYYIQHVNKDWYLSLPKKSIAGLPCLTAPIDEQKYYQRWRVRFEKKDDVPRFEEACFITEATEEKFSLGLTESPNDRVSVVAKDIEHEKSWMVQDTVAKMKADKRKADRKAAKTKDADKEDTSDKDDASDPEASKGEAAKEDTSDKDGASDPQASKDEAANVTTYTILKRHWKVNTTQAFNWCVSNSENPGKVTLSPNVGMLQWKFVPVNEDAAAA